MREIIGQTSDRAGVKSPRFGGSNLFRWRAIVGMCVLALLGACKGKDEKRTLDPIQLGMASDTEATYDLGEDGKIYEVARAVQFPIVAPTQADIAGENGRSAPPFAHYPYLTNKDVSVQVTWTLSNLDETSHNVSLILNPWNEFGRYVPGITLVDADNGDYAPNLGGNEVLYEVPGTKDSLHRSSRRHGVITIEDMNEMAIDFATVMNIIANPPTNDAGDSDAITYVNHAFAVEQRSNRDVLTKPFIPGIIPGLTGFDLVLRTTDPVNIAVEIVVEVVDKGNGKVLERDSSAKPMDAPTNVITLGTAAPAM
jgi:hypothetical protein